MFMIDYRDISWWYWLATAMLLSYGMTGRPVGFILAIGLVLIQLIHYIIKEDRLSAFTVQVRFMTLVFFVTIYPSPLQPLYWVPTIGLWAQVIFGYCAMARCVSLISWNRDSPISYALLMKTFFSLPVRGSVNNKFIETE